MIPTGHDSLKTRSTLDAGGKSYAYYSLAKAAAQLGDISRLPFSMKVLLENLIRFEDGVTVTRDDLQAMVDWQKERSIAREIQYRPARVLMQDFTGVPAVVDLAAMRDAMANLGGDPQNINPLVPVHLVIDHSVMVDEFGTPMAFERNVELEYARNGERYQFLKWATQAFDNFQVVPPGTGICHQVNLEHIAQRGGRLRQRIIGICFAAGLERRAGVQAVLAGGNHSGSSRILLMCWLRRDLLRACRERP